MAEQEKPTKEKMLRIAWGSNENTPVQYANHILVTYAGGTEFHITFGHLNPPLTLGMDESELPEIVTIKPLTTIVTSPEVMKAFVEVLKGNLAQFEKNYQKENK